MTKLPPPLTDAQRYLLYDIKTYKGVVHFRKPLGAKKWLYSIVWNCYQRLDYTTANTNVIKALIRKGALVPEISNKEFEVQLALGTTDHRVYKLPKLFIYY